jgi:hypothetical protein
MSDNNSSNSQSSSDSQSNVDNSSSSSSKNSLQGGEIKKELSRLRYVNPQDTMTLLMEGYSQKNTEGYSQKNTD